MMRLPVWNANHTDIERAKPGRMATLFLPPALRILCRPSAKRLPKSGSVLAPAQIDQANCITADATARLRLAFRAAFKTAMLQASTLLSAACQGCLPAGKQCSCCGGAKMARFLRIFSTAPLCLRQRPLSRVLLFIRGPACFFLTCADISAPLHKTFDNHHHPCAAFLIFWIYNAVVRNGGSAPVFSAF